MRISLKIYFTVLAFFAGVMLCRARPSPTEPQQDIRNITSEVDSLKKVLEKELPDTSRLMVLRELASSLSDQQVDTALGYILKAKQLMEVKGISNYAGQVYFVCGVIYMNKTDNRNALQYYFKALRIFEKQRKFANVIKCYNNIGVIYMNLDRNPEALIYFKRALDIKKKEHVDMELGLIMVSIGSVLSQQEKYDEAESYFRMALEEGQRTQNYYEISMALINLAHDNNVRHRYAIAKKQALEALMLNTDRNDQHHISICNFILGQIAMNESRLADAEQFFKVSASYAQKVGLKNRQKEIAEQLSQLYFRQKRFEDAYEMRLSYDALKDSAINNEVNKQVTELQTAYELEKKNNVINLLSRDKKLAEANASRDYLLRNILISAVVLILFIAIILLRNVALKQKLNRALSRKNEQISEQKEAVEKKNEVLNRDNISAKYEVLKSKVDPHFLFNSLSTLQSLIMKDQEQAIIFVEKFSELYRLILDAGEQRLVTLRQEMSIVNNYLYLQKVKSGENVTTSIIISEADMEQLIPSFVIQMMVENAIKHNVVSASRKLFIRITATQDEVVVSNNLQPKQYRTASTFTGHKNIKGRYELLGMGMPAFYERENTYFAVLPLISKKHKQIE